MNKEDLMFLFAIAKEIKRSFENPVILLTMKDYAEEIYNSLLDLRALLLQSAPAERVAETVYTFHINWLQAVQDIENFKKRAKDTPREVIQKSIDFTIECLSNRCKYFQKYIKNVIKTVPDTETALLQTDVEIIKDMREVVHFSLIEKQKCLQHSSDKSEFCIIILHEIDELLNWLDTLNDHLAIQFSNVLNLSVSDLPVDLNKALERVIDEMTRRSTPEALTVDDKMCGRIRTVDYLGRVKTSINDTEISKVIDKIKHLEDRIAQMKVNNSTAGIMALEHKAIFLEERLESLEQLKISLDCLINQNQRSMPRIKVNDCKSKIKENEICIFNHLLPHLERNRLVEELVHLWQAALGKNDRKSFVSILSASDLIEVFSDEIGKFTIDIHGRKIYKTRDDNDIYQLNENNELVSVKDDERRVYFYDECGRYYLTDSHERVYKASATASEYVFHRSGFMLKVGEVTDGVEYKYDNLGRYFIEENGGRIYRDKNSSDIYRPDGLGNLLLIRDEDPCYEPCPVEPSCLEESKYLKEVIGAALKKSLAEVVLVQPTDPIKYLADRLEKYRNSIEARQKRIVEEQLMMAERGLLAKEHNITPPHVPSGEADFDEDYNFIHYISNGLHE